ncbi:MAG TPA: hypothetical protein VMJ10_04230 [Kofleriaceae bacterium]|nr:hypothetical protein [Kofleriaceae bacterium]
MSSFANLARRPGTAVAAAVAIAWLLTTLSPVRAMGNDTIAGTLGGVVYHCGGGYDLRNIDWIDRAAATGRLPYFAQPGADGELIAPYGPLPNLLGSLVVFDLGPNDVVGLDALRHRVRLISSLLVALCAGLLAWAARPHQQRWRAAATGLVAAASFAGCATLGQALWQQTISLVPLVGGFALLVRRADHPRLAALAPAALLAAAMIRPTIGPLALGLGVWWAVGTGRSWRTWAVACAAAIVVVLPLVAWNVHHQGSVLPLGQWRSNTSNTSASVFRFSWSQLAEGVPGLLISPARGLAWFAPIALVGIARALRARSTRILGVALVAQFATMAVFYMWWGGFCFGPRFLTEVAWLATWAALATPVGSKAARIAVVACAGITVVVGLLGLAREPMKWEVAHNVDADRSALWQLDDSTLAALITNRYGELSLSEGPRGLYRVCVGTRVELIPGDAH